MRGLPANRAGFHHVRAKLISGKPKPSLINRIYSFFQSLQPPARWITFRALSWIAGASRPLHVAELLSAVAADCRFSQPHPQYNNIRDEINLDQLKDLLTQTGILSTPPVNVLHRKDARILLHMITEKQTSDGSWIHAGLAITCLRCIETCQPEAVLFALQQRAVFADHPKLLNFDAYSLTGQLPFSSHILEYAMSNWHTHFRLAEPVSRRQASILHKIIEVALAEWVFVPQDEDIRIVNNVGLILCALHDFPALARTYLEMGTKFDAVVDPWGTSALHVAAACGSVEVLAIGVLRQPDLSSVDHRGMTALQIATLQGQSCTTEILIRARGGEAESWRNDDKDEVEVGGTCDAIASIVPILQHPHSCTSISLESSSRTHILIHCFREKLNISA